MEIRQLRYFVTLADELHFGRAAAREHIVQSALSQQLQRLERELGVRLLERSTHHVQLTPEGSVFLLEARQILAQVDRARDVAQRSAKAAPALRVGLVDASYDSMAQILRLLMERHPELEIHQIEEGMPQQVKMLLDGRLDIGLARASRLPSGVASELVRLDRMGVLVSAHHRLTVLPSVPVAALAGMPLLFCDEGRGPEFNEFLSELCRVAGFVPVVYPGTVTSVRGAHDLVVRGRCVLVAPSSSADGLRGVVWKQLTEPVSRYPWSLLWRAGDKSRHVRAALACARVLAAEHDWLGTASEHPSGAAV